jgi:hypothetical protein
MIIKCNVYLKLADKNIKYKETKEASYQPRTAPMTDWQARRLYREQ